MRARRSERLVIESAEERESRLQAMRVRQSKRLAVESAEEREARLQKRRDCWDAETP